MIAIYSHIALALAAVPVGLFILLSKKGTAQHKLVGRVWLVIMLIVSLSAILIHEIYPGRYSLIHLLIPWTIGSLIYSIWNIKRFKKTRQIKYRQAHMYSMIGVYIGALLVAGAFTLLPGRFLYGVFSDEKFLMKDS